MFEPGPLTDPVTNAEPPGDPTPGYEIDPPRTCHGDRNAVIQLNWLIPYNHIHVAVTTYSGDDDFLAEAYCADGLSYSLAKPYGRSSGRAVAFLEHPPFLGERLHTPRFLSVQARGPWTVTIVDLVTIPSLNAGTTRGHGDAVLVIPSGLSDGLASYTSTHNGKSNFIVSAGDDDLHAGSALINVIGPYSGKKAIPSATKVITIAADGDWTIKRNH